MKIKHTRPTVKKILSRIEQLELDRSLWTKAALSKKATPEDRATYNHLASMDQSAINELKALIGEMW